MKLSKLILIADAVEKISELTEIEDIPAIVNALTGLAWDEKDGSAILAYHQDDDAFAIVNALDGSAILAYHQDDDGFQGDDSFDAIVNALLANN